VPIGILQKIIVCMFACLALSTQAQTWPTKPVHIVVAFAAGGPVDTMARTFAGYFGQAWGQPVVVDNRPGTGGHIGAEAVANAAPDGLTLLMTSSGQATGPALYRKLNYDPVHDLAAVSMLIAAPSIFVTNPNMPAKSIKELIALAKSQPGKINYGSSGVGSGPHLSMEFFKVLTGTDMVHVPFKGDAQLYPALFSNDVQLAIIAPQTGIAHIKAGRLRAIAVTGAQRFWSLPDTPGMIESGLQGFDYRPWVGIFAPAKTPRDIINRVNAECIKVLGIQEMVEKHLRNWGVDGTPGTPEAFAERYLTEIEMYKRIVREAQIPQIE